MRHYSFAGPDTWCPLDNFCYRRVAARGWGNRMADDPLETLFQNVSRKVFSPRI